MNSAFLKRLMKEKKEDVVHSSAYASAQSGGSMGATSAMSFEQRKKIDRNRSMVRRYSDSMIANEAWLRVRKMNTDKFSKDKSIKENNISKQKKSLRQDDSIKRAEKRAAYTTNNARSAKPLVGKRPGFYR